eukprot:848027_1
MLDNFAFIAEYYVHAMADDNKNEKQQWFYFFDRSFKYIVRIGKLIQHFLLESPREESPIQNMRGQRGVRRSFRARLIELYEEHIGVEIPDTELKSIYSGEARTTDQQFAAFNWYTLARLWLEKNAEKKTIRGDIEKGDIILPNGEVSNKDVTSHPDRHLIELGRKIWTAIQAKIGINAGSGNPTHVWERDTFYKQRSPQESATAKPWTEVVQTLRRFSENVLFKVSAPVRPVRKVDDDHLKNGVLQMMYNICGEEQFVTNVMHGNLLRKIHVNGMLKGVVKAYKKYEKKGQKLTIPSDEAYNYKYFNPYTTIKFKAQSKLGVAHGQMLRPEQEAERQFPGEDAANS